MWVAELACAQGHRFEGWFASQSEFESQRERGLLQCPQCGTASVQRSLSAPRLNLGAPAPAAAAAPAPAAATPRAALRELLSALWSSSEDLGRGFVAEARRIHQGQAPERAIRGQASAEQREALRDEGIAVLSLPHPDALADEALH